MVFEKQISPRRKEKQRRERQQFVSYVQMPEEDKPNVKWCQARVSASARPRKFVIRDRTRRADSDISRSSKKRF